MNVTRTRRVTCIADEVIEYVISDELIAQLMGQDGLTKEEAVEEALSNGLCSVDSYDAEIDEVVMEHESTLTING
jgi:hypothetical protein